MGSPLLFVQAEEADLETTATAVDATPERISEVVAPEGDEVMIDDVVGRSVGVTPSITYSQAEHLTICKRLKFDSGTCERAFAFYNQCIDKGGDTKICKETAQEMNGWVNQNRQDARNLRNGLRKLNKEYRMEFVNSILRIKKECLDASGGTNDADARRCFKENLTEKVKMRSQEVRDYKKACREEMAVKTENVRTIETSISVSDQDIRACAVDKYLADQE